MEPTNDPTQAAADRHRRKMIEALTFEVVPLKSFDDAVAALPPSSEVSVTCSPVKGIEETMRLTDQLRELGHVPTPHIAARMVSDAAHVDQIATWLRTEQIGRIFLVGGDGDPLGPYADALSFLRDLLGADPALHTVGFTAYPDGHSVIASALLSEALHSKQSLLSEAGVDGYATTQMCFDPDRIREWLEAERRHGFVMPVRLGVAGVVDRTKLMTMGARLGIGTSLSYLKKNRKAIGKLMSKSSYDPNSLLIPLSADLERLEVRGIHCFTFNQIEATENWRREALTESDR